MAGKVGVSEGEYNAICADLKSAQEDFIRQIDAVKSKISAINCKGGGFYTDNVSPNIKSVLEALDEIQGLVREIHSSENEIIDSFRTAIDNIDTCC